MTAKEYLSYLPNIQLRIHALQRSIQRCVEIATATESKMEGAVSTRANSNGRVASAIEQKYDLERELRDLTEEYQEFSVRVVREINRIPNSLYVAILIDRYVNDMPWETIAVNVGNENERYVRTRLHEQALSAFEKNNPKVPESAGKVPCISPESNV